MSGLGLAIGYGIVTSAILGLSAIAMSLQFGVTKHANLAHGELLTVAAYTIVLVQRFTSNLALAVLCAVLAGAATGWLLNRVVLMPFRKFSSRLSVLLIVTFSAGQIIQGGLALGFGLNYVNVSVPTQVAHHVGPFLWTTLDEIIIAAAVAIFAGVFAILHYTSFGRSQRAVADDPVLATAKGIRANRVLWQTWLLVGGLAGLAGVALAVTTGSFNNQLGFSYMLVTFAAVIVGGLGKVHGALVGAVIIGMVTEISGYYLSSGYKQVFALTLLLVVLILRPSGIFVSAAAETRA
jgi:branched-subunit amino acid ABC-type transport system permease component